MMTADPIRDAQHAKPFLPFTIHTADGDRIHVTHPECILLARKGRTVVVNTPDDRLRIIDTLLITQLSFEEETPRKKRRSG